MLFFRLYPYSEPGRFASDSRPPLSLPIVAAVYPPLPDHFPLSPNPFRINTYKSVTKQTTLTCFRINTYEKHRGEGAPSSKIARPHDSLSRLARMRHNPRARGSIRTNSRARRIQ